MCGGICDTIRDHRLPSGGIGADDKGEFGQLAGEVGVPEQTLREGVGARLENGSVRGGGLPVHSCSDFIWFAAQGVDAPFVLRREGFKVGGDMACDRFQGKVVDWSGTDEFDGDPGFEKVSEEGFAGEQRSKPFSGLPEICRLGYRSNALIQALRHSYLEVEGKPSRNSEFFREMVCSGWFKNVGPLRQAMCSGKRGSLRNNVNKKTSKTNGFSISQDKVGTNVKKGSGQRDGLQNTNPPSAAEDLTKKIDGRVGRDAGKTKETVEVTIAGKTVPHRPMETDPLTGRAVHRLAYFKIMDDQEKLEDKLLNEQLIQREKILAKKRQQIHLMAELVERTNVPTAKQERAAWKPGGNQEKKHSSMGDEATI